MEDRSREAHTAYLQIIFGMKFRQYHVAPAWQKADMSTKNEDFEEESCFRSTFWFDLFAFPSTLSPLQSQKCYKQYKRPSTERNAEKETYCSIARNGEVFSR